MSYITNKQKNMSYITNKQQNVRFVFCIRVKEREYSVRGVYKVLVYNKIKFYKRIYSIYYRIYIFYIFYIYRIILNIY
jgi:hypothetical protein